MTTDNVHARHTLACVMPVIFAGIVVYRIYLVTAVRPSITGPVRSGFDHVNLLPGRNTVRSVNVVYCHCCGRDTIRARRSSEFVCLWCASRPRLPKRNNRGTAARRPSVRPVTSCCSPVFSSISVASYSGTAQRLIRVYVRGRLTGTRSVKRADHSSSPS